MGARSSKHWIPSLGPRWPAGVNSLLLYGKFKLTRFCPTRTRWHLESPTDKWLMPTSQLSRTIPLSSQRSSVSNSIDVPFDVCYHIASFLPPEDRRNLYMLNRAFFTIAMDGRYQEIHLGREFDEAIISRGLSRLKSILLILNLFLRLIHSFPRRSPHAQRVRMLHLYPDVMAQYLSIKENNVLSMILTRIRRWPLLGRDPRSTAKTEMLLQSIGSMSNVRQFILCNSHIWQPHPRDLGYLLRMVVTTGRATFGNTLRSLTLNLSLEGYHYALTPALLFPNLEALSVTLSMTSDGRKLLRDLLIPFINVHHSTLLSLALVLGTFGETDLSPYLLEIHHLSHLQKLDFYYGFTSSHNVATSGLQHILRMHSNELRELSLGFGITYLGISSVEWFAQECFRVPLPHLQSLSLKSGCWWDVGLTAVWLRQFEASLSCLILDRWRFSFRQVETIVNVFTRRGLHTLYLSVHHMTPELVDMLERTLPGLLFLQLKFAGVCASEFEPERWNEDKLVRACKIHLHDLFF